MELDVVTVPGGYESHGGWHRRLWVRPWTGLDQIGLGSCSGPSPAARATHLLSRCTFLGDKASPVSDDFVRELQVGDREALLLHLRRISVGERLPCVVTCGECAEELEFDLAIGDLLVPPYAHEGREHQETLTGEGSAPVRVRFRLPNGGDQELAATLAPEPNSARRMLIDRCVAEVQGRSGTDLSAAETAELARAMSELDPQAELLLEAACPACGVELSSELDATSYVCDEARSLGETLHAELHLLALHYHWSEAEILGMSAARRRSYVRFLLDALGEGAPT